jgi:hypothetical protein
VFHHVEDVVHQLHGAFDRREGRAALAGRAVQDRRLAHPIVLLSGRHGVADDHVVVHPVRTTTASPWTKSRSRMSLSEPSSASCQRTSGALRMGRRVAAFVARAGFFFVAMFTPSARA